jgi:hypothetical protein
VSVSGKKEAGETGEIVGLAGGETGGEADGIEGLGGSPLVVVSVTCSLGGGSVMVSGKKEAGETGEIVGEAGGETGGEAGGIEGLGGPPPIVVSVTCSPGGIDAALGAPACGEALGAGGLGVGFD